MIPHNYNVSITLYMLLPAFNLVNDVEIDRRDADRAFIMASLVE